MAPPYSGVQRQGIRSCRVQASRTGVLIKEHQEVEAQKSGWVPWLNPFGRKQQAQTLVTISETELWQLLEAEQQGECERFSVQGTLVRKKLTVTWHQW